MPSWFTPRNALIFILIIGGISLLLIQQAIDISKGLKYDGNEFHTKFTTSFVFGWFTIFIAMFLMLYQYDNEDLFNYLTLFGALGGIALSMMQIHFSKLRLNYGTMD